MATIKSYTDLEQSKKLAKILPLESADMCWQKIYDENHMMSDYRVELIPYRLYGGIGVPCWSLPALLGVLSLPNLIQDKADGELFWHCSVYDEDGTLLCETYDNNPIDAYYELILKLNELKML